MWSKVEVYYFFLTDLHTLQELKVPFPSEGVCKKILRYADFTQVDGALVFHHPEETWTVSNFN